jgi:ParB family chromosome partitioning protein
MSKKKLGRDLGSLLSGVKPGAVGLEKPESEQDSLSTSEAGLNKIAIEQIRPSSYQPRKSFSAESLHDLSESIKRHGLLQPVLVRKKPQGDYELIAGERRWRAAKLAGLEMVPAVVRNAGDQEVSALALVENIQRDSLNAFEEALALARLRDEFDLTQEEIASAVGRSRAAIANLLRLLALGEVARDMLQKGDIELGHARALLAVDDLGKQDGIALEVYGKGLSVRQTEALVKKYKDVGSGQKKLRGSGKDPDVLSLERAIGDHLGAKTTIKEKSKGSGELIIGFSTLLELEGVVEKMGLQKQ